eukprot:gb/GECH01004237.1/.p1 GENE.gb/GECH01004237.1/~~gb/GECH01004237.1/.p1  ORF type:complete len:181 (+),score=36.12 gb/GECH01004237.1/:1-543(+)
MEEEPILYIPNEFSETTSGTKISRSLVLCGSTNISIEGMSILFDGVVLRGDLSSITMGKYCIIESNTVIRPPMRMLKSGISYFPMMFEDYIHIGKDSVIQAAKISSYVKIGNNTVVGARCVIQECAVIEDDTVLPPDTVVPAYTRWRGNPGQLVDNVNEATERMMTDYTIRYYRRFTPTF